MKAKFKTKLQTPPFFCKNFESKVTNGGFSRFLLRLMILGCLIYGTVACSTVSSTHTSEHTSYRQKAQSIAVQKVTKLWGKHPSAHVIRKKAIERSYSQLGYLFGVHPPLFLELPISDFKHVEIQGSILKPRDTSDLWDRIRTGMTLDLNVDNALIEKHREWYINHPEHLEKIQERASRYLYFIVQELESRNLPLELALLPAIESAYNPFAYSHASASGLWQFIPNTGKHYGLKQNGWYDGRRDVIASTHAAIEYLSDLNEDFDGDWMLSLAAYNTGSFNISKAQLRNQLLSKPKDYWSLTLSKETQNYVPRFVALAQLLSKPEKYGVEWTPIPNKPEFTIVTLTRQVDLLKAAKAIDMEPSAFFQLNAGYKRWSSAPVGPHRIVIPIEHSEKFQQALAYA